MARVRKYLPWQRVLFASLTLLCLATMVTPFLSIIARTTILPDRMLFRYAGGSWQRFREFDGKAVRVAASPSGDVWIARIGIRWFRPDTGLSVIGRHVIEFGTTDFDTRFVNPTAGPVFDGPDTWLALDGRVFRYNGEHWQSYRGLGADAEDVSASLCAAQGQVWAVWNSGRLSHFDGRTWTSSTIGAPGLNWNNRTRRYPQLARTANGWLWLIRDGVWRFDGKTWAEVTPKPLRGANLHLLGAQPDHVWVDANGTWSVNSDGSKWSHYDKVRDVRFMASGPRGLYLSTLRGVMEFDGQSWRSLSTPLSPRSIAVEPDGSLWVVATRSNEYLMLSDQLWSILIFVGLFGSFLAVLGWIWWERRRIRLAWKPTRQLALELTASPDARPTADERFEKLAALVLVLAIVLLALSSRTRLYAAILFVACPAIDLLLDIVSAALKRRKPALAQPIASASCRIRWDHAFIAQCVSLFFVALVNPAGTGTVAAIALLAVASIWFVIARMARQIVQHALDQSDYYRAVQWSFLDPDLRARVLIAAGRLAEAQQTLHDVFEETRSSAAGRDALETLRLLLVAQHREADTARLQRALGLESDAHQSSDAVEYLT